MSEITRENEFNPEAYVFEPVTAERIRSRSVLPAQRENFTVTTADGKRLVGELSLPAGDIKATLVTFHPLPTHGGYMDSHVYKKASFRLPELANIAVLRFNTRGTRSIRGVSEGVFDGGFAEKKDFDAILKFARERSLPNLWLVGWSFGTELVLKYGPEHASEFTGAILLSPPLHRVHPAELDEWNRISNPLVALVPELDDYLRPEAAGERFGVIDRAQIHGFEGCKHLWVGEKAVNLVLNAIVSTVTGESTELPTEYTGLMAQEITEL
ncbi:MAG: alpha/beta hydrolase [Rothia sp. (in: high G+C Gram-positive bacteria)]|uniref:alpha/beta hydrolase n=1 Tax=Rothia sp. (in: high G+C Gram-positive bacteria) TaxID=1885016 RepID=UPI0026DF90A7|nr:alpha/beta hydrolase [Rothia sp. (in: high G+C Gram-positive bacteria)]MDO5750784.1 alpha/beta hydrolase [Rothia sp. (in: high G+C Gram-positive bacteria)]